MRNKLRNLAQKCASICVNTYKDYETAIDNINIEIGLKNRVASLSNYVVADELMYVVKQIAYANKEPNHETICKYLNQAIKDLLDGMDAADVLGKYDRILYDLRNPKKSQKNKEVNDMNNEGRERLIQNIKDCGQSLIDNAENIVGNYKYFGEVTITCYPTDRDEAAHIEVTNNFYPENYIERHK